MTAIKKLSTNNTYAMIDRCTPGAALTLYYRTDNDGDYTDKNNWNTVTLNSDQFADLEIVNDSIYCTEIHFDSGLKVTIIRINTDGTITTVKSGVDVGIDNEAQGDSAVFTSFSPETSYFYICGELRVVYGHVDSNDDVPGSISTMLNVQDAYGDGAIDLVSYKPGTSGEIVVSYLDKGGSDYKIRTYNGTSSVNIITPSYHNPYVYHTNGFYISIYDTSTLVIVETDGTEHTYNPSELGASGSFVRTVVTSNLDNRFYIVMQKSGSPDYFAIEVIDGPDVSNLASQKTINTPIAASDFYINSGSYNSLFMVPHTRQNDSYVWYL
jgi:hypothetical protein